MAGKKKSPGAKKGRKEVDASKELLQTYVKLRTILDAIELGSLRYFLTGVDEAEKMKRAKKLLDKLIPLMRRIQKWDAETIGDAGIPTEDPGHCPDGYYMCYGACVPYPCPD